MKKSFCDFCGKEDDGCNDWFCRDGEHGGSEDSDADILFFLFDDKNDVCVSCFMKFSKKLDKLRKFDKRKQ